MQGDCFAITNDHFSLLGLTLSSLDYPKLPGYVGDISLIEAIPRKYLKEICSSGLYLQLALKYFAILNETRNLCSKISRPDNTYLNLPA